MGKCVQPISASSEAGVLFPAGMPAGMPAGIPAGISAGIDPGSRYISACSPGALAVYLFSVYSVPLSRWSRDARFCVSGHTLPDLFLALFPRNNPPPYPSPRLPFTQPGEQTALSSRFSTLFPPNCSSRCFRGTTSSPASSRKLQSSIRASSFFSRNEYLPFAHLSQTNHSLLSLLHSLPLRIVPRVVSEEQPSPVPIATPPLRAPQSDKPLSTLSSFPSSPNCSSRCFRGTTSPHLRFKGEHLPLNPIRAAPIVARIGAIDQRSSLVRYE